MGGVAYARAGYKAQGHATDGRVIVKLCHIVEVSLERLEVNGLVNFVHL